MNPKKFLILLIVAYALFPPVVVQQVGVQASNNNPVFDFIFAPLLILADKFSPYRWVLNQEAIMLGVENTSQSKPYFRPRNAQPPERERRD